MVDRVLFFVAIVNVDGFLFRAWKSILQSSQPTHFSAGVLADFFIKKKTTAIKSNCRPHNRFYCGSY